MPFLKKILARGNAAALSVLLAVASISSVLFLYYTQNSFLEAFEAKTYDLRFKDLRGPIPPNPGEMAASRRLETIIESLSKKADMVIVDTPALLAVGDTPAIAARVDGVVLLADMKIVRKPQLLAAAEQLMRLPVNLLGTVVRLHGSQGGRYAYSPSYYYRYTRSDGRQKTREQGPAERSRPAEAIARVAGAAPDAASAKGSGRRTTDVRD